MNRTIIFSLTLLLSSCSYFSTKEDQSRYIYPLVTGKNIPEKINSSQKIQSILAKEVTMAGGNYEITTFPIIKSYVEKLVQEQSHARGIQEKEVHSIQNYYQNKYLDKKVCFEFASKVIEKSEASDMSKWNLFLKDQYGYSHKLKWDKNTTSKEPVRSFKKQNGNNLPTWSSLTFACSNAKVDLSKPFSLTIKPNFVQFPFDKAKTVFWDFEYIDVVDGKEVKVEKKDSSYQAYRGW